MKDKRKATKGKKLTIKQKGFIKDLLITKNATESAMRNYNVGNRKVAQTIGSENIAKPIIQNELEPFINEMIEVRSKAIQALKRKNLDKETAYLQLEAINTLTKNIQLLSGGKTENVGLETDRESLKEILKELRK